LQDKATQVAETNKVLSCIRLLTRVLPFAFEEQSDAFAERVFWLNKNPLPKNSSGKEGNINALQLAISTSE
jgi:hypothetical protein